MTEYEIVDAFSSIRNEVGNHVMNFVAVLFGYLVTANFVGSKLSRFQVSAKKLFIHYIRAQAAIGCLRSHRNDA